MKTIKDIELLKRLEPLLNDIGIEYFIDPMTKEVHSYDEIVERCNGITDGFIPTLTLDEINPFIKTFDDTDKKIYNYFIKKYQEIKYDIEKMDIEFYEGMLEYLLDQGLLGKE